MLPIRQRDRDVDFLTVTKRYYAKWVNVAPNCLEQKGVYSVASPERDRRQRGYGRQFDLYCLLLPKLTIISYGRCFQARIARIERCFGPEVTIEDAKDALYAVSGIRPQHAFKYHFTQLPTDLDTMLARQLTRDDYPDFLSFHRQLYPNSHQGEWLKAYFTQIAYAGYVHGIYVGRRLASATDAPDVPYMRELIVEPGINTLPEYRQRGYAKTVVGALIKRLLDTHKAPIWSCSATNIASQKLAASVGFVKFADVLTLTCTKS
jgi:hypothetical protein